MNIKPHTFKCLQETILTCLRIFYGCCKNMRAQCLCYIFLVCKNIFKGGFGTEDVDIIIFFVNLKAKWKKKIKDKMIKICQF